MTDDLITRFRTVMAEVEARLQSSPTVGVDVGVDRPLQLESQAISRSYADSTADVPSANVRDTKHLKDYVPSDTSYGGGFDEAVFMGTGDSYDPLHHQR